MRQTTDHIAPRTDRGISVPTVATCLELMDEHEMLANIREHSFTVARAAETILEKLMLLGIAENLPPKNLVVAGALLHDIAKTDCIKHGGDHARIGYEICEQIGYGEIGGIVREHVWLVDFSPKRYQKGIFLAKELIYYADKRVLHDNIVSLSARLDYILERYGNNDHVRHSLIKKNFNQCQELECWLCQSADCSSDTLLEDINLLPYTNKE
jgi:uncharacterized protein